MAEESDLDKTEAATPRRLEKAREEGQIVRSRELNTFLLLGAGVALLWLLGAQMFYGLRSIVQANLAFGPQIASNTERMLEHAHISLRELAWVMLPIFGVLVVVAVVASISLGGWLFSLKGLAFKGERLNPLRGIKRMFSSQTLVELLKTLAKAACVATVAIVVISYYRDHMIMLMYAHPTAALTAGMRLVALCCGLIVGALLFIVLIDAPWQVYSHHKKLRMSRQDVKQEHKESEGDPHVRSRIRQQQRAMSQRRMMSQVPQADVIITNPTHVAVALQYQEGGGAAPRVVAKGADLLAHRIRALAKEHNIAILEAAPLARALYRHVELDHEIPAALYAAVAEVLAWVYQLKHAPLGAVPPPQPNSLHVPPDLDPAGAAQHHQANT